mmetsp:Transcript_49060/g.56396  ORF Transcript_49060/g.56396 Transcript_49060/m.56396 type:complete len:82 (-) Transcript_49060:1691-1936(-)
MKMKKVTRKMLKMIPKMLKWNKDEKSLKLYRWLNCFVHTFFNLIGIHEDGILKLCVFYPPNLYHNFSFVDVSRYFDSNIKL